MDRELYQWNYVFNTPDSMVCQYFPNRSGHLRFKVRAKHDAHIVLSTVPYELNPMYEVIIGGWKNGKIAVGKDRVRPIPKEWEVNTPNELNCNEFKEYFITWRSGVIEVGRGKGPALIRVNEPRSSALQYVGIRTCYGATGQWIVQTCPDR